MMPATWSRWATLRALFAHGVGDGVAPASAASSARSRSRRDLRGGPRLDQAAQAEADVPALVALDALHALAHAGQRAVGQVVEQRVLPGVEDDPLEQHVVEADALAEPGRAPPPAPRPSPAAAPRRARAAPPGRGSRAAARRSSGVSPGSPSTSAPMRSKSFAWRCSSRRWRKKTQAIRLSWEASVASRAASANGVELLGDGVLGDAEAGEQRRQPIAALGRELRPRAGVRRQVDGHRIPLQAGHDLGEEVGPEAALREHEMPGHDALPELPLSHAPR